MTEREKYLGAIKVLRKRGWCQGSASDSKGRVCLGIALEQAGDRQLTAYGALEKMFGVDGIDFNDRHCKTARDAIAALAIAADLAA